MPTIGILERLPGPEFEDSGAIIVMTDSDCISQQRQIRSCNFLFEQFVDIATRDLNENTRSSTASPDQGDSTDKLPGDAQYYLLNENLKLPSDLHKISESPVYETLEDLTKELLLQNSMIKNSYLNSLTAFDYVEKKHICPVRDKLTSLAKKSHTRLDFAELEDGAGANVPLSYVAYQHQESDENISQWTVSSHQGQKNSGWWSWFTSQSPLAAFASGQQISGPYAMVLSFFAVFLFGVYMVKRCLLKRAAVASINRRTQIQARHARRQALHLNYESSDGYSGSEMEFDQQSTSNYEPGDMSISFDYESDAPADYH